MNMLINGQEEFHINARSSNRDSKNDELKRNYVISGNSIKWVTAESSGHACYEGWYKCRDTENAFKNRKKYIFLILQMPSQIKQKQS